MHQPFYKDLWSGQYRLPWTRLHALKDYAGMVSLLDEFPRVRQTFNLVPSMVAQIEEYASGASDPFFDVAALPAEDLTDQQRTFALRYLFQSNLDRMIRRYPRYLELYEQRERGENFSAADLRDLQVLSQIAWWDEDLLARDGHLQSLVAQGRGFSRSDQDLVTTRQREALQRVLPVYRHAAAQGRIEISTTPFYHPILPLICDTEIAAKSRPGVTLPPRFRHPEDAREQLARSRSFMQEKLGIDVRGLWPSEGSVSDEALELAADCGFRWAASDNGVLAQTLGRMAGIQETYAAYVWRQHGREMRMLFRDHFLSDLIGFSYSNASAAEAAEHFLTQIRQNTSVLRGNALVPIILDGENAWEYYDRNGRPFLRELYARISADPEFEAVTVSEALERFEPHSFGLIYPGSWINANFDIWIGAEEDNRAWELLLDARRAYETAEGVAEQSRKLAYEELLIAEGSDWCWWYGPEHHSDNRVEFDQLYRDHLSNVYRALGLDPPPALSQPILGYSETHDLHQPPTGPFDPGDWSGAGRYRPAMKSGAMHQSPIAQEMLYGTDGGRVRIRLEGAIAATYRIESDSGVQETLQTGEPPLVELSAPRTGSKYRVAASEGAIQLGTLPFDGWIELPDSPAL
jgi:alpha-amylase/alpha-mannosidase (GH57 family)